MERNEMLDAAYRIFIREGIQDLRMRAIAEKIGVTKSELDAQFANKQELVTQSVERALSQLNERDCVSFSRMVCGRGICWERSISTFSGNCSGRERRPDVTGMPSVRRCFCSCAVPQLKKAGRRCSGCRK